MVCMQVPVETRRLSETLELEVPVVVSHSIRVLGTKLRSSSRVERTLNC